MFPLPLHSSYSHIIVCRQNDYFRFRSHNIIFLFYLIPIAVPQEKFGSYDQHNAGRYERGGV
jgi:hypothetical protein